MSRKSHIVCLLSHSFVSLLFRLLDLELKWLELDSATWSARRWTRSLTRQTRKVASHRFRIPRFVLSIVFATWKIRHWLQTCSLTAYQHWVRQSQDSLHAVTPDYGSRHKHGNQGGSGAQTWLSDLRIACNDVTIRRDDWRGESGPW